MSNRIDEIEAMRRGANPPTFAQYAQAVGDLLSEVKRLEAERGEAICGHIFPFDVPDSRLKAGQRCAETMNGGYHFRAENPKTFPYRAGTHRFKRWAYIATPEQSEAQPHAS